MLKGKGDQVESINTEKKYWVKVILGQYEIFSKITNTQ